MENILWNWGSMMLRYDTDNDRLHALIKLTKI